MERALAEELLWIRRRAQVLMRRDGLAREEAIARAVDEQMSLEDFQLELGAPPKRS